MKVDDLIIHRKLPATIWRVLRVNFDGTLEAKFVRGGRLPNGKEEIKTITRPEDYRKVE